MVRAYLPPVLPVPSLIVRRVNCRHELPFWDGFFNIVISCPIILPELQGSQKCIKLVMGNPVWDRGPLLDVAVHIVAETVTQPYFGLQFHHSFNDNVLSYVLYTIC